MRSLKPSKSSVVVWFQAGIEYELTEEDLITIAWSCVGEGGSTRSDSCAAIIWSQVTRFLHYKWANNYYPDLKSLVRAFSQPVNPKWLRKGEKCIGNYTEYPKTREDFKTNAAYKAWLKEFRAGLTYAQKMCTEDRIARRERFDLMIKEKNVEALPALVYDLVKAFSEGGLENPLPAGIDDFRSTSTAANPNSGIQIGGNLFSRSSVGQKAQRQFGNPRRADFKVIYDHSRSQSPSSY